MPMEYVSLCLYADVPVPVCNNYMHVHVLIHILTLRTI